MARVTDKDQCHKCQLDMYAFWQGTTQSAQLERGVCGDLRNARIKTAIGNLAHVLSPACELGKACIDAKGVRPRCNACWRSLRSSPRTGKPSTWRRRAVEMDLLGELANPNEVKTFDN